MDSSLDFESHSALMHAAAKVYAPKMQARTADGISDKIRIKLR
jgi:hypothetical protein